MSTFFNLSLIVLISISLTFSNIFAMDFWVQTNGPFGIRESTIETIAINSDNTIFAGTHNGVYYSTDRGNQWQPTKLTNVEVRSLSINRENHIFAATNKTGMFRSTDNGENWTHLGLMESWLLSVATKSRDTVFVGTYDGLLFSTDNGEVWLETPITKISIKSLHIDNNGYVYAGAYSGKVYLSKNNLQEWELITDELFDPFIEIASIIENYDGCLLVGTNRGVYLSTDYGKNWKQSGLNDHYISSFVINSKAIIFAGTKWGGIYISNDGGLNWNELNAGLTNYNIISLGIDSISYIYAGTIGAGVFRSIEPTVNVEDKETDLFKSHILTKCYPNPFDGSTTFEFVIPGSEFVTLTIFNALGIEVANLISEFHNAGKHKKVWNASAFPSGTYFYKIQAGQYFDIRKLILLK